MNRLLICVFDGNMSCLSYDEAVILRREGRVIYEMFECESLDMEIESIKLIDGINNKKDNDE